MVVREEIVIGSKADTRGFKKADTAAAKLNKTVKSLAGTLGVAYGATALVSFGKAAVKAFAADEAAAIRLSTAVNNLGISFANPAINKYIQELELTAGIADDVLRPAFQKLLTTTGSLTQSQKLLNDAITVSRASGIDLATVAQDLANGYVGITRGLKKYNTGLTQAELKSKSFSDVLGILLKQSAGAANAYLATTSFKFDVLTVAVDNAKEAIGKGLVDALARAGGGTEVKDAVKAIDAIAKGINAITFATGTAVGGLTNVLSLLGKLPKNIFQGFVGAQGGINTRPSVAPKTETVSMTAQQKALAKLEKDAAVRAKKLADAQTKAAKALTAEQKKQAALKKAGSVFDLEQIQIIAALQGDLSKQDELRLKAQLALLNNNEIVASALTKQILMSQDATGNLYKLWQTLPDAKNPFAYLEGYLDMLAGKAAAVLSNPIQAPVVAVPVNPINPSVSTNATNANGFAYSVPNPAAGGGMDTQFGSGTPWAMAVAALNRPVVVQIDGKAVASSLQDSSLSGIGSSVNRVTSER
jgi:hypothetical protein